MIGGSTEEVRVLVDMMADNVMDFRTGAVMLFYGPNFVSYLNALVINNWYS